MTRQIIRDGGRIRVIDHTDLPDTAVIIRGGFMGSPSVSSERLRSGTMLEDTCKSLAKYLNIAKFDATLWYVANSNISRRYSLFCVEVMRLGVEMECKVF